MNKFENFRNEINISNYNIDLDHSRNIISLGSCFASKMHELFNNYGFDTLYPYRTIYNPVTIANNLNRMLDNKPYNELDITKLNEVFFSWFHSGRIYGYDKTSLLEKINQEDYSLFNSIKEKPLIIITFGSSIVFSLKNKNQIVANCHKQHSNLFTKRRLSIKEIVDKWIPLFERINADFIVSVSPVRHYRNGFIENNRSKAVLLLAIEELIKIFPQKVTYFPSYEIMMDELRDYRFYGKDWVHPSEEAINYIWKKFSNALFSSSVKDIVDKISNIRLRLNHKPNYGFTNDHKKFLIKLREDIVQVANKTPLYNWHNEIKKIDNLIS